ncbi:MAG: tRNA (N(6)-L-threonylcarbamoyladenosine(37)-C(2))-methylthiotransferase MtaB [Eubacteriales bacterium]|nr:tRNA (N(6)-L-threonylcarbamoyladenosine(37)-C(2))-methylthiotransferase MtaB [Eubacteriales bacterium]MDD3349278.1 tRNA (N(6)-L-threonylcarbamoyladenosine(37)-C(2))-methylthiotransferase MtaB [Eubacteriales bacterium]
MKKIAFYTLGCKVNQYETQALKEKFVSLGYEIVGEQEIADVYVINTCTVTGLADRKSRQYIRRIKKNHPQSITAVIGCYAQTRPEEVKAIDGVDIVLGTNEKNNLPNYVEAFFENRGEQLSHIKAYEELNEYEETGVITSMESRTRAYLKIQEGCNQFCSYCIIPVARGSIRSRRLEEIKKEAENLIAKGFKEIVITGINTALYGAENVLKSTGEGEEAVFGVEAVIRLLNEIPGEFRIRLGSLEPTVINAAYVKRLLTYEKLCPHMHLSLQSGSDKILSLMNRHYNREAYQEIVKVLRQHDPGYGLSTDIIVGFPGETENDFNESVDLVEKIGYSKVHVFPYSQREGTRAAGFSDQISPKVKKERAAKLTAKSEAAAIKFHQSLCGTTRKVLFEEYSEKDSEIQGLSDNYIRIYCSVSDAQKAEALLHRFADVQLITPYKDGIKGDCR